MRKTDRLYIEALERHGQGLGPLPRQRELLTKEQRALANPTFCVYRLYNAAGTLLYVGYSSSVFRRIRAHMDARHWSDAVVKILVERWPTRDEALLAEAQAIAEEGPLHNREAGDRLRERIAKMAGLNT